MAENTSILVNKIDIKTTNRNNLDIEKWRSANKAADRGKTTSLYDIYEDVLLDNVLDDAIDKRITAIANAELTFTTHDGETVEEMATLIDTMEFETILREIMLTRFWGVTLLEFEFGEQLKVHSIPRKHIRAQYKEVAINQNDDRGIRYNDDFFLEVGNPKDFGMILKAAPFVIYKRNNMGDWAQYVELFGMPVRTAYYEAYDDSARIELVKAVEQAGSALVNVLPKGCDFKIEPSATSGDGAIYNNLRGACNEEILIGILGQTMTTLDGSSRSQGEVHLQVQQDKHKADRRFVQRVLNAKLLPMLEKRGYPVKGGYFYFPEAGETISLKDRIAIDMQVAQMVPISAQYVYDTYGVARPEDGEDLASQPQPTQVAIPEPPDDTSSENTLTLLERVRSFFVLAPTQGAFQSTPLQGWSNQIVDNAEDDFDTQLIKRVGRGEVEYFDAELFTQTAAQLVEAFSFGWAGKREVVNIGVTYGASNDAVITANETNLYHFAAAKTLAEIQQLNQLYRDSRSFEEYYQKAVDLCGKYNKSWARTEYQTARLTAESAATYQRLKAQTELFPYWEYRTVGDDKVREEHAALDGVILPANDPRWRKIYPPNGWKCRCWVAPRIKAEVTGTPETMRTRVDDYFKTADWEAARAQGFDINRGEVHQVFTANQMYVRKFPNNAAKYLDKLTFKNYGLDPYTKCLSKATEQTPRYDGSAKEWYDANKGAEVVTLTDHNNRSLSLTAATFKAHTTGSHTERTKYLQALPSVVKAPDEIWLNSSKNESHYDNYTYIKYYQDEILVVNCHVGRIGLFEIQTWYPLSKKTNVINHARRGLLIHKKASQ